MTMAMELRASRGAASGATAAVPQSCTQALGHFVYALLRPMRYDRRYRKTVRALSALEGHVLKDIGLGRGQIEHQALMVASAELPARGTVRETFVTLLQSMAHALRTARDARRSRHELLRLNDHMLRDIGLPRDQVPTFLEGVAQSWSDAYATMAAANEREPARVPPCPAATALARMPSRPLRPANDDRAARAS